MNYGSNQNYGIFPGASQDECGAGQKVNLSDPLDWNQTNLANMQRISCAHSCDYSMINPKIHSEHIDVTGIGFYFNHLKNMQVGS